MDEQRRIQVALRLMPKMHALLKRMAEDERRSLHSEILVLLEEAIAARERASKVAA